MKINNFGKFLILLLITFLISLVSVFTGAEKLTLSGPLDDFQKIILFDIRIPRILLSLLCGALLGGTGAVFQGFFRNPLADSGVLGISSGATFGAVLFGFLNLHTAISLKFINPITVFAFCGSLITGFLIFSFSGFYKRTSSVTLLLAGTSIGTFLSSLSSLFLLVQEKNLHTIYVWTMGSFNAKGWNEVFFFIIPSVISLILLLLCSKELNILGSGEKTAVTLGVNLKATKIYILFAGSLATACAVCAGGIISFVGLISPHLMRPIFGSNHKVLIPASMLTGAVLLTASDAIARLVVAPAEIPVGIITALIGVPFFIVILKRS